jgi:hypothetical protein
MVEHDQQARRTVGAATREDIAQGGVWERRGGCDYALVRFKGNAIEERALLEAHRYVGLLGLREQSTQCRILGAIRRDGDRTQPFAGQ